MIPEDIKKSLILGKMERYAEAIRTFDEILRLYPDMANAKKKLEALKYLENKEDSS